MEKPGSNVRIVFLCCFLFYFSGAFNTIQPRLVKDKQEQIGGEPHILDPQVPHQLPMVFILAEVHREQFWPLYSSPSTLQTIIIIMG